MALSDQKAGPDQFRLQIDLVTIDDWPPVAAETVWVTRLVDERYAVDNVPFFVRGLAPGDTVLAKPDTLQPGLLRLDSIVGRSGHSVVRVIVSSADFVKLSRDRFSAIGCDTELSSFPLLFAVDIPPNVRFRAVEVLLKRGVSEGWWDYEEGLVPTSEHS